MVFLILGCKYLANNNKITINYAPKNRKIVVLAFLIAIKNAIQMLELFIIIADFFSIIINIIEYTMVGRILFSIY